VIPESLWVFFSAGLRQKHRIFDWNEIHPFSADSLEILFAKNHQDRETNERLDIHLRFKYVHKSKCSLYFMGVFSIKVVHLDFQGQKRHLGSWSKDISLQGYIKRVPVSDKSFGLLIQVSLFHPKSGGQNSLPGSSP